VSQYFACNNDKIAMRPTLAETVSYFDIFKMRLLFKSDDANCAFIPFHEITLVELLPMYVLPAKAHALYLKTQYVNEYG